MCAFYIINIFLTRQYSNLSLHNPHRDNEQLTRLQGSAAKIQALSLSTETSPWILRDWVSILVSSLYVSPEKLAADATAPTGVVCDPDENRDRERR